MAYIKLITLLLLFSLPASSQTSSGTPTKSDGKRQEYPSYIIFGIFCAECRGHCATMYRYNMIGNSNTLFVDSTDSYLKNYGKIIFRTQISDINKFKIINELVGQIPKSFLMTDKAEQTFGCPDCFDGCGIYFEIGQNMTVKKFYIDTHTEKLESEVKVFGEFIKKTMKLLNRKN